MSNLNDEQRGEAARLFRNTLNFRSMARKLFDIMDTQGSGVVDRDSLLASLEDVEPEVFTPDFLADRFPAPAYDFASFWPPFADMFNQKHGGATELGRSPARHARHLAAGATEADPDHLAVGQGSLTLGVGAQSDTLSVGSSAATSGGSSAVSSAPSSAPASPRGRYKLSREKSTMARQLLEETEERDLFSMASQLFDVIDINGDGDLEIHELREALRGMDPEHFTEERVVTIFGQLDINNDASISRQEFCENFNLFLAADDGRIEETQRARRLANTVPAYIREEFRNAEKNEDGTMNDDQLCAALSDIFGQQVSGAERYVLFEHLSKEQEKYNLTPGEWDMTALLRAVLLLQKSAGRRVQRSSTLGAELGVDGSDDEEDGTDHGRDSAPPVLRTTSGVHELGGSGASGEFFNAAVELREDLTTAQGARARAVLERDAAVIEAERLNGVNEGLQERIAELERQLRIANESKDNYHASRDEFRGKYEKLTAAHKELEERLASEKATVESLEAQLYTSEELLGHRTDDLNATKERLENIEQAHESLSRRMRAMQTKYMNTARIMRSQIKTLSKEVRRLKHFEEESEALHETLATMQDAEEEHLRMIDQLVETVSTLRKVLSQLDTEHMFDDDGNEVPLDAHDAELLDENYAEVVNVDQHFATEENLMAQLEEVWANDSDAPSDDSDASSYEGSSEAGSDSEVEEWVVESAADREARLAREAREAHSHDVEEVMAALDSDGEVIPEEEREKNKEKEEEEEEPKEEEQEEDGSASDGDDESQEDDDHLHEHADVVTPLVSPRVLGAEDGGNGTAAKNGSTAARSPRPAGGQFVPPKLVRGVSKRVSKVQTRMASRRDLHDQMKERLSREMVGLAKTVKRAMSRRTGLSSIGEEDGGFANPLANSVGDDGAEPNGDTPAKKPKKKKKLGALDELGSIMSELRGMNRLYEARLRRVLEERRNQQFQWDSERARLLEERLGLLRELDEQERQCKVICSIM